MTRAVTTKRREFLRLSGAAAIGTVIAACAPATSTEAPAGPKTDTTQLTIAVGDLGKQDWRPWISNSPEETVRHMIGDSLIRGNAETGALEPGLAESWTVSPDGRVYTFKLRPNIPFHDGYGTVTAEDVKFTWEQTIQKDSTFGAPKQYMTAAVDNDIKNFEITGPLEFRLTTRGAPAILLLSNLSNTIPGVPIQSKKYWTDKPTEAPTRPIGTGPWKFVSSTPGVDVKLQAVDSHWKQKPAFKNLTLQVITDVAARLAQVQSGAVDLAVITPGLIAEAKKSGVKVLSVKEVGTMSVVLGGQYPGDPARPTAYDRGSPWIQADSPDKGLAIRQALSLAIDRKTIIERVLNGEGTPVHAPFVEYPTKPQLVDSAWKLPVYDVAQAKAMLAKGGYPNGFDVAMPIFENRPGTGGADVGEAVAGMWEAVGIKVKRQVMDFTAFRPHIMNRTTAGMAFAYMSPYFDEALQAFAATFTYTGAFGIVNDLAILAALPKWTAEPDVNKRYAITREVEQSLIDSVRAVPLFTVNTAYVASKKIGAWKPLPRQSLLTYVESITPANP